MKKPPKIRNYEIKVDVWLEHEIIYSKPFRLLSAKTSWVLLRFLQKRKWHHTGKRHRKPVFENEGIAFTYAEANHFGIRTSTFHTIIKKLVEVGFINIDHQGGAYGNDYSRYNLSDRWRKYGTTEFEKVIKKRVLQGGLDVRSNQERKLKLTTNSCSYVSTENRSYEAVP